MGACSNSAEKLEELRQLRDRILQRSSQRPTKPAAVRPRHGEVQRAVLQVLETTPGPMSVKEIQVALARLLGRPVAKSSVSNCLVRLAVGKTPRLKKKGLGQYEAI